MLKRNKGEPSLSELQENIITALTLKINQRADSLEQMIIANSNTIEDLKMSLNHVYVEIQDLKNDKTKLAEKFTQQQKRLCKARLDRPNDGSRSAGEGLCVLQSFLFTTQQEH